MAVGIQQVEQVGRGDSKRGYVSDGTSITPVVRGHCEFTNTPVLRAVAVRRVVMRSSARGLMPSEGGEKQDSA